MHRFCWITDCQTRSTIFPFPLGQLACWYRDEPPQNGSLVHLPMSTSQLQITSNTNFSRHAYPSYIASITTDGRPTFEPRCFEPQLCLVSREWISKPFTQSAARENPTQVQQKLPESKADCFAWAQGKTMLVCLSTGAGQSAWEMRTLVHTAV